MAIKSLASSGPPEGESLTKNITEEFGVDVENILPDPSEEVILAESLQVEDEDLLNPSEEESPYVIEAEFPEDVETLVWAFLALNPNPTDDQVHALAHAVNMDKETLESVFYKLLGELTREEPLVEDEGEVLSLSEEDELDYLEESFADSVQDGEQDDFGEDLATPGEQSADTNSILEGEHAPELLSPDDLLLNDGDPTPGEDPIKDVMKDDGVDESTDSDGSHPSDLDEDGELQLSL